MKNKPTRINGVLFDFDGTLTRPGAIDFLTVKKKIGCPDNGPLIEFIQNIKDPDKKREADEILNHYEGLAAENAVPNPGAEELILKLKNASVPMGIITRNNLINVRRSLENFSLIDETFFKLIIARGDGVKPKPDPEGIHKAAKEMNVDVERLMVVGDFIFDVQAGENAGAPTVFLDYGNYPSYMPMPDADYHVSGIPGLWEILKNLIPLPAGKIPMDLLKSVLNRFYFDDPSVLINPGIGEDIAAVNASDEEILILKSDPITFATDAIAHYAVLVNANDIATSGAIPRWFLATILFPAGVSAREVLNVFEELKEVCQSWNITLCGGHTEITDAVNRTVISGMLSGSVKKEKLVDKRNMETGDKVLLTKGVSVEGTSIIAREFENRLLENGLSEEEIKVCKNFLLRISILPEAAIAAETGYVSAMHDVTEGGVATALQELTIAGQHKIRVDMEKIPVFPETEKICEIMKIDPLGLIGSGSLIICCRNEHGFKLMEKLKNAGIEVALIGEVTEDGEGIQAFKNGKPTKWPLFEVDEIARVFG